MITVCLFIRKYNRQKCTFQYQNIWGTRIMFSCERDNSNNLADCLNGDRFFCGKGPITPPLNGIWRLITINFTPLSLAETWLQKHNVLLFNIPGYKHEYNIRSKIKVVESLCSFLIKSIIFKEKTSNLLQNSIA